MELKGKMVEVYFGEDRRWKMGTVIDVKAEFEKGGTEMQVSVESVSYTHLTLPTKLEV